MARFLPVLHVLSLVVLIFSFSMLFPLLVAVGMQETDIPQFFEAFGISAFAGIATWFATRGHKAELKIADGFLLVVLVWTTLPAFAALPLMFFMPELSFTDAYFETVSGLTTTGATVLSGLDKLPASINLWRGELVWLGGMGLIVLAVAVLPLLGVGGRQIYRAETPGPMKDSKLTPRITETAKGLWGVYLAISIACFLAYRVAGMSWVDALMHAFTTMGLGGFSTHDESFGWFNSPTIEAVCILFMGLAGINFATHFLAWRKFSAQPYRHDPEAALFLAVTIASVAVIAAYLRVHGVYGSFGEALRYAAFNTVSIATTTGYANTDYNQWPLFAPLWMLFLCSFASCSGSTGGGIKMIRAQLLYKQVFSELVKTVHPRAVTPVKLGGHPVPTSIVHAVLAFMFMYVVCTVSLTLLMVFTGLDAITAFSAVVACLNNTGPGLNQVGPATTYASLSDFQTWVCSLAMLLGRLELMTVLIVLTPSFWRR